VRNLTHGVSLSAPPWTADMLAILDAGGLLEVLRRRVTTQGVVE
jgi:hypothetical protein